MRDPYDKKASDACKLWRLHCLDDENWMKTGHPYAGQPEIMRAFNKFLGAESPTDNRFVNVSDPDVRRKLDLILGSHGVTVLKMMKIRQDEKQDDNHQTQ